MIRSTYKLISVKEIAKCYVQKMCHLAAVNVIAEWKQKFTDAKIRDSDFTIKCIISHVLNVDFATLNNYNYLTLSNEQKDEFDKLCECRLARMPIQYIVGNWDFRKIQLRMLPPVFIPRPETEQIIDIILKNSSLVDQGEFLEIGCGSGAICCSLLQEMPRATVVTVDSSRLACNLTKMNAKNAGVIERLTIFHHKVSAEQILPENMEDHEFDFIVSNPPYIKTRDIMRLEPEIKLYEDLRALDGGPDGMNVIRILFEIAGKKLKTGGRMWLEIDSPQIDLIRALTLKKFPQSLTFLKSYKDVFKRERFVEIQKL